MSASAAAGGREGPPPKLIHVTTTDMSLELLLGPQLRAFAAAGYEVLTASAPGPYVDGLTADGIRHLPLRHATRSMAPHRDAAALAELYRLFRRERPTIVHTHNPKPGVYGRLAARAARVPVIVNTVHGLYALPTDPFAKRALVYSLERLAAACSGAELVQNPEDIPTLRKLRIPASRLHLLGNGVDLRRFSPTADHTRRRAALRAEWGVGDDEVVIGAVGRLVWEKGYRELFDAAARVRAAQPRARFVVAGGIDAAKDDAVTRADLDDAAEAAGIVFLGHRDDVEELYAAFDVYVLASHREGFPRSAMEAAAMGLPIVATDIRGCRQVVDHDHTGLLVPVRSPGALATALATLVAAADRRTAMGYAARAKAVAEFDHQHQITLTLAVYDKLTGARRRSS